MNIHVRDTFISQAAFSAIPSDRQARIQELVKEYNGSGYISAWDIGPDQAARLSDRQRERLSNTRLRVFRIEEEIRELLKSDDQLKKEAEQKAAAEKQNRIQYLRNRLTQIMTYCKKQLFSNRMNATKREWEQIQNELKSLQ